ncbi:uncharacterized protein METZ01_LOCUS386191, partial [marine metagenome]
VPDEHQARYTNNLLTEIIDASKEHRMMLERDRAY